jgi:hypothetical protein
MKLGYYCSKIKIYTSDWITPLLPSVAAECWLFRLQRCHKALPSAARAKKSKSYRDLQTASSTSFISHPDKPNNPGGHLTSADNLVHQAGIRDDAFNP